MQSAARYSTKKMDFILKNVFFRAIQIIRDTLGGGGGPKCHKISLGGGMLVSKNVT
jgi:hypothetical protein